jgi:hypothetical protein
MPTGGSRPSAASTTTAPADCTPATTPTRSAAIVVGEVDAPVLLLRDLHPVGEQGVAQGAEVERLAVDEHAVEVEDDRLHRHEGAF